MGDMIWGIPKDFQRIITVIDDDMNNSIINKYINIIIFINRPLFIVLFSV